MQPHRRVRAEEVAQHLGRHARCRPRRDIARRDEAGVGEAEAITVLGLANGLAWGLGDGLGSGVGVGVLAGFLIAADPACETIRAAKGSVGFRGVDATSGAK